MTPEGKYSPWQPVEGGGTNRLKLSLLTCSKKAVLSINVKSSERHCLQS